MRVEFYGNGIPMTNAIFRWTHDRLLGALRRHEPHVVRVEVRLRDLNGPRGGDDKECGLIVHLRGRSIVTVKDHQSDLYAAISNAAGRLKNVIACRLARAAGIRQRHALGCRDALAIRVDGNSPSL